METRYRLGGVLCLAIASAVFWWAIWLPLQQASEGAALVKWVPRATVLVAMCLVFGLFFLATGGRYPYRDEGRQSLTSVGWVLIVVLAIVSFAGYFAMETTLRSMGYY